MYKSHSIWDEEQDKYDSIVNEKQDSPDYHDNKDYASNEQSNVYSSEKAKEEENKKEATGIEKEVTKQEKKYEKKEDSGEEDIKKKAASEIHDSTRNEDDSSKKKKTYKSIEDAINKAIKEEKELIYMKD